jgi:hypothetical protein
MENRTPVFRGQKMVEDWRSRGQNTETENGKQEAGSRKQNTGFKTQKTENQI